MIFVHRVETIAFERMQEFGNNNSFGGGLLLTMHNGTRVAMNLFCADQMAANDINRAFDNAMIATQAQHTALGEMSQSIHDVVDAIVTKKKDGGFVFNFKVKSPTTDAVEYHSVRAFYEEASA